MEEGSSSSVNNFTGLASSMQLQENAKISYLEELEKIYQSNKSQEEKVDLLDLVLRDFLAKKFHVKKDEEYTKLIDFFLQKGRVEIATFCHTMIEVVYSGEKLDTNKIKTIFDDVKNIVNNEQETPKKIENTIKDLLKMNFLKKKNKTSMESARDTKFVSKQLKKAIDESLDEKKIENPKEKLGKIDLIKQINSPLYKLNPANLPAYSLDLEREPVEFKYVETIDDMERIKDKIRERKRSILAR